DAVLGAVTEQVGQGVGQFGRGTQGDLVGAGRVGEGRQVVGFRRVGAADGGRPVVVAAGAVVPLPVSGGFSAFEGSSGFAVVRHAPTISRIPIFRLSLWITPGASTSIRTTTGSPSDRPGCATDHGPTP